MGQNSEGICRRESTRTQNRAIWLLHQFIKPFASQVSPRTVWTCFTTFRAQVETLRRLGGKFGSKVGLSTVRGAQTGHLHVGVHKPE